MNKKDKWAFVSNDHVILFEDKEAAITWALKCWLNRFYAQDDMESREKILETAKSIASLKYQELNPNHIIDVISSLSPLAKTHNERFVPLVIESFLTAPTPSKKDDEDEHVYYHLNFSPTAKDKDITNLLAKHNLLIIGKESVIVMIVDRYDQYGEPIDGHFGTQTQLKVSTRVSTAENGMKQLLELTKESLIKKIEIVN